jgi:hypothetical protein
MDSGGLNHNSNIRITLHVSCVALPSVSILLAFVAGETPELQIV